MEAYIYKLDTRGKPMEGNTACLLVLKKGAALIAPFAVWLYSVHRGLRQNDLNFGWAYQQIDQLECRQKYVQSVSSFSATSHLGSSPSLQILGHQDLCY